MGTATKTHRASAVVVDRDPVGGCLCLVIYVLQPGARNMSGLNNWSVYIILCDDGSLYTGVSTDIDRRFREHGATPRGAKYFNGRKPLRVVYGCRSASLQCRDKRPSRHLSANQAR